MLGARPFNTASIRDDPTSVIGRYDMQQLLPIAAFLLCGLVAGPNSPHTDSKCLVSLHHISKLNSVKFLYLLTSLTSLYCCGF